MITFEGWPKTPRLFRDMVVTEKIDGTNAAVVIEKATADSSWQHGDVEAVDLPDGRYMIGAQSRKRLIRPDDDNFGFAAWVQEHAADLVRILGPGRHFGEWWGSGIQRGYGLTNGEKRFSLFNVNRYSDVHVPEIGLSTVPLLASGPFDLDDVRDLLADLKQYGSIAAPAFDRPEGVVVFHSASGQVFKALIENDAQPKGQTA